MNPVPATLEADAALAESGTRQAAMWSGDGQIREEFAACERLPFRDVEWFADQGVSACKLLGYRFDPTEMGEAAFCRAFPGWPPIDIGFEVRRARVQFLRSGRVVLTSNKRADPGALITAFVIPAFNADGVMTDLIAWRPRTGHIGSTERTAGWLAGGYVSEDEPLIVHPDPLAWLRAGRQGVVVVHEDLARPALLAQRTLQAADVDHGEALQAMLSKVRLPRIVVPAFPGETARRAA
ncbi:hypothetical protein MKK88_02625 [Methylobacterium sp. E-005]|uniref:hypothetical protein n=1 Tax=Methylobacterium sp. E-005 TaxID=2836549 RepID=UPI001FBA2391|nr:hypothetical protein [Methylobacterium sp. E-005]MCJ2084889.1 hypothetical protein [Methylobacterium sp. E-005]